MTHRTPSTRSEPTVPAPTSDAPDPAVPSEAGVVSPPAFVADRRVVLRAGGLALCAGALAACSSPPVPTGTSSSSSAAGTSAGGSSSAGASTSAGAAGTPISDVPVGGAAFYPDTSTIVTQPQAGTLKAFDMTCPHQQNPVRRSENGQLVCTFHGSRFDLSTGAVVQGPATSGLTPKQITVTGDTFTVA